MDIHRDPQTGQCKGYAFIQYVDTERAKVAVKEMNGLAVTGSQKIGVQLKTISQRGEAIGGEDIVYAGSKTYVMNSLLDNDQHVQDGRHHSRLFRGSEEGSTEAV